MIKPTCAKCGIELICDLNNIPVIHFLNDKKENGIDALAYGDRWRCPKCGALIVIGFGGLQLGYDISFQDKVDILKREYVEIKRIE